MSIGQRRTAFPNIWIESIEVQKPPFDERGVIQEFVGRGALREFEPLQKADDITPEMLEDAIQNFEESIGPLRDSFRVRYNLIVRATPSTAEEAVPSQVSDFGEWIRQRVVTARARTFVRVKNPFEPDIIEADEPRLNRNLSQDNPANFYDISVSVTK